MNKRNFLYIGISIICILAIIIAVYYQIFKTDKRTTNNNQTNTTNIGNNSNNIDLEKIKNDFNLLFTNEFYKQNYEIDNLTKYYEEKDFIYTFYSGKGEKEDAYSVNLNLPAFNINDNLIAEYNNSIQEIFINKANNVLKGEGNYIIYNIDYVAYINEDIISLVIKSNLKEGANAQRTIVQTYNYNAKTGKKVNLKELLEEYGIDEKEVNKKIEAQVKYADENSRAIAEATSQAIYKRDLNSAIYLVDNIDNFFIGENGKIYIVYAYGNSNFTSEIDIIVVE